MQQAVFQPHHSVRTGFGSAQTAGDVALFQKKRERQSRFDGPKTDHGGASQEALKGYKLGTEKK